MPTRTNVARLVPALLLGVAPVLLCGGADWLQFRGPNATSVTTADGLPTELSEKSVKWAVDLPGRGVSTPIVIGDRVVVTAGSGPDQGKLHVLCYATGSGELLWERTFTATGRTLTHRSIGVAAPSPASDGERIFAFYSSNDMACLDLEGNLLWYRGIGHDFPNASNSLGMSSSPVVIGDTVVTMVESDAEAFTVGLDAATGKPKWRIERPRKANWSSPGVLPRENATPLALIGGSKGLTAVDPTDGTVVWNLETGGSTIPSATAADGIVYAPIGGVTALKPTATGTEELWKNGSLGPRTCSPVVSEGVVYSVSGNGVLMAGDAKTGELIWRARLAGKSGCSGTPIVAGKHAYLVDNDGLVQVVELGADEGTVTGKLALEAKIQASPAAAGGALYVRSDEKLWKIAE